MDFLEQLKQIEQRAQNYRYGQAQQNLKELVDKMSKTQYNKDIQTQTNKELR